LYMKIRAAV